MDPQLVVARPHLLREEFDRSISDQRMMATMVGLFGAIALVLTDPATFAGVCAVLFTVGVIACLVPARRAMRVNPAIALRNA